MQRDATCFLNRKPPVKAVLREMRLCTYPWHSVQMFLFGIESLFVSASLSWGRARWGMQNASCSYSSACEESCLAKWLQDLSEAFAVALRNGLKERTECSAALGGLRGFHAQVPRCCAQEHIRMRTVTNLCAENVIKTKTIVSTFLDAVRVLVDTAMVLGHNIKTNCIFLHCTTPGTITTVIL